MCLFHYVLSVCHDPAEPLQGVPIVPFHFLLQLYLQPSCRACRSWSWQGLLGKVIPSWHALTVISVSNRTRLPSLGSAGYVCIDLILHRKWATMLPPNSKAMRLTELHGHQSQKATKHMATWREVHSSHNIWFYAGRSRNFLETWKKKCWISIKKKSLSPDRAVDLVILT